METITILVIFETLMEKSEDGTLYEIDNDSQYIGYRNIEDIEEHLEMERNKMIYDGIFDDDYDEWRFTAHADVYDDNDISKGFERTFETNDGKVVIYKVTIEPLIMAD